MMEGEPIVDLWDTTPGLVAATPGLAAVTPGLAAATPGMVAVTPAMATLTSTSDDVGSKTDSSDVLLNELLVRRGFASYDDFSELRVGCE